MNGQILVRIDELEKQIKQLKSLVSQKDKKSIRKAFKKSALIGLWKGLEMTDEELEQAKKDVFDFDVGKYVK